MAKKSNTGEEAKRQPLSLGTILRSMRREWRSWGVGLIWLVPAVLLLAPPAQRFKDHPGDQIFVDVQAPSEITVPDTEATARRRRMIQERHDRIWLYRPEAEDEALARLNAVFAILTASSPDNAQDVKRIGDAIGNETGVLLSSMDVNLLYKNAHLERLREDLSAIIRDTFDSNIIVDDKFSYMAQRNAGVIRLEGVPLEFRINGQPPVPIEKPGELRLHLREGGLRDYYSLAEDARLQDVALKILMQIVEPNLVFSPEKTQQHKTLALMSLEDSPITITYEKGDWVARSGDVLSEAQALALQRLNELRRKAYPYRVGGVIALTIVCFVALALYFNRFRKEFLLTPSNITMTALPVMLALLVGRLLYFFENRAPNLANLVDLTSVLYSAPLVGMLTAILIGANAGFILVLISVMLFGVATNQPPDYFIIGILGGFTAVISLQTLRERRNVLTAGLRVGIVNMVVICILSLFKVPSIPNALAVLIGFLNGLGYGAFTLPLMVIFERAFGVVTEIRLLELTGTQHKLLREMEKKSPGSYQHVLNVTKLAESAAEAIGAGVLLVRAGAMFHDVGKMLKPKYFSENQITLDDKKAHSKISPYMSTLIIKNHVKEGIELAKKEGLPQKVVDFIPQHHGTSLIKYFYNEALRRYEETQTVDVVREEDFRYPGPKPQSKETAIVMLADSVEAITTSVFTTPTINENDLRRVVGEAINDRFQDGQFDQCDLTMRDLSLIRDAFVRTLKARYHHRIAYPTLPKKEPVRDSRDARDSGAGVAPLAVGG